MLPRALRHTPPCQPWGCLPTQRCSTLWLPQTHAGRRRVSVAGPPETTWEITWEITWETTWEQRDCARKETERKGPGHRLQRSRATLQPAPTANCELQRGRGACSGRVLAVLVAGAHARCSRRPAGVVDERAEEPTWCSLLLPRFAISNLHAENTLFITSSCDFP